MNDQDDIIEVLQDAAEECGLDNFFIDILTGNKECLRQEAIGTESFTPAY